MNPLSRHCLQFLKPAYQLTEEEFKLVRVIDDVILYYEFIYFMNESIFEEKPELKSNPTFVFEGFEQTENEFKQLFEQLIAEI